MQKLFYNGPVITMESEIPAESLLIEDDKVVFAGPLNEAEAMADKAAQRIDLEGYTLMPAFCDPHSHFTMTSANMMSVDMAGAKDFDEVLQRITAYIAENNLKPGDWVRGVGYDHNFLAEKSHPVAAVLDKVSPENPVFLKHVSGHVGVYNSLALKLTGVADKSDAIEGGYIEIKDGKPTGYMEEKALFFYNKRIPVFTLEELHKGFEKVQQMYLSNGITFTQESVRISEMMPLYEEILQDGSIKLDVVGYPPFNECEATYEIFNRLKKNEHLRLGGYKVLLDGSPQGRTAWMREPYENSGDYCSYGVMDDDTLYSYVCKAVSEHKQLLAHCNGDAAAEQYISAFEKAQANGYDVKSTRPVLVHAQLTGRDQLKRLKNIGMIPSFFVAHVYHWGDIHLKNFGAHRANYISATGSALKDGLTFTLHQDTPVIPPNVIETLWCATNRETKSGVKLSQDECISVYDALRAVTVNSAYQYFEEDIRGALKKGMKSDLIILSSNPLTYPKEKLRDIKVLATFKNGCCLYKNNDFSAASAD